MYVENAIRKVPRPISARRGGEALKALVKPAYHAAMDILPDRWHAILAFALHHGRMPNLSNPTTFNEKVVWRKLYDLDPRLPDLIDKITVKEIIAERYGEDLIIPTLAVFGNAESMDFTRRPLANPPYVVKASHGTTMNLIVRSLEGSRAPERIRSTSRKWLKTDHSRRHEEWGYGCIKPRILVEEYLSDIAGEIDDFKLHVFSGKVFAVERIMNRFSNPANNIYDRSGALLDLEYGFPRGRPDVPLPACFGSMIELAERIGAEFSYVRVDLYEIHGRLKFGELTFYPGAGNDRFHPEEWDLVFGQNWAW